MGKPLHVLIVEDSDADAELLQAELERAGYDLSFGRVQTAAEMRAALEESSWDLVLSDYSMPTFSGPAALELLKASGHDIPFIIVSGTIGEETAVSALKSGANDFLVKGRLARLAPAIERELRDVEARRLQSLLQDQLRQSQKMEAIGQLAGGIAHDFNNLLTAILGFCELLLANMPSDAPDRADLLEIQKAGVRAAGLTRQLLAFSRRQVLQPKVHDLNALVSDVEPMLRRLIAEHIAFGVSLDAVDGLIKIDSTQLEQILVNLVVNAGDAMPRGGRLTLSTADARDGGHVLLTVQDTGVGMDDATRRRIFEPFFTTKGVGKGTGLGLATVQGIVTQSGGDIAVYSAPDRGSTFTISFPREALSDATVPQPAPVSVPRGSETVLVVEDDTAVRHLARVTLQRNGYRVLEAGSPREALGIASAHTEGIQLLLSDVIMPDSEGAPLVERLRTMRPSLRVLYMSGYTDDAIVRHGVIDERTPFLQKPFTPAALAQKVREVLDARSGQA